MADEIKLKAPTVEQQVNVIINGEEKLKSFASTLEKISSNKNLHKYFKDQKQLIKDVSNAYGNFTKTASKDNALELMKTTNALKALSGVDISSLIPDFKNFSQALENANRVAGNLDSAFSVSSFKDAFSAFETLRAYGVDLENLFKHFAFSADVSKLTSDLNNANEAVSNLKSKVTQLEDRLEESESGNGIRAVREECENLRWEIERIRDEAAETFSAFLTSNGIDASSYKYEEFFERIRDGSLTAQEAIAEFKRDYSYLLDSGASFDTTQLQDFSKRLDDVLKRITDVSEKIDYISSNGVRVNDYGGSGSGDFEELANVVNQIENTNANGSASAIYESLSKILTAIKEIGQCDTDNIYHLYATIRNLSQLDDLKINKASLDNLAGCLERICGISDSSALTNLSLVDLKNFNDLHISKASLNNLAEYLPQIATVDVDTLTTLANIDFDKLNSLHIDKDSMKNLFSFVEGLRSATGMTDFTTENKNVESSADTSIGGLKTEAELMESIATNAEKAAKSKKEFVEANNELAKATDASTSALAKENGELSEAGNKSNISSPIKDVIQGEEIKETIGDADKLEEEIQEIVVTTDKAEKSLEEYKEKWKVLKQTGDVGDDKYSATFEKNAGQIESVIWKAKRDDDGNVLFDEDGNKEYEMLSVTISNYEKLEKVIVSADNELRKLKDRRQELLDQNPAASTSGLDAQITYQEEYISLLEQTVKHISQADEYLLEEQQIIEARNKAEKEYQLIKGSKKDESASKDFQKRNDAIIKANRFLNTQEKIIEHIAKTYDKALNPDLEKSVNNPNDLTELAQKKSEIQTLITKLKNSPRDASNEQEYLRLEKLIAEYKDLADYKKKANNPTKQELGGQKLETLIAQTVAEYDKLIIRAKKYGEATKDIVDKLKQQRDLLAQTDGNGKYTANANDFYDARDVLKVQKADFGVFEATNQAYEEATKINNALNETEEKLSNLSKLPELSTQFADVKSKVDVLNKELQQGKITISEYNKSVKEIVSNYSKMVDAQQRRDVETYNANAKKTSDEEKEALKQKSEEWDKNVKAIQEYMDANTKLNNLKAKDAGTGKHASEIAYQTEQVKELEKAAKVARAALSSMINPHDVPIEDWNKWLDAMKQFDQATKGSAESVAKLEDSMRNMKKSQLESMQSQIKGYKDRIPTKPKDVDRNVEYQDAINRYKKSIDELQNFYNTLNNSTPITPEQKAQWEELISKANDASNALNSFSAAEKGSTKSGRWKEIDKISKYLEKNTRISKEAKQQLEGYLNLLKSGTPVNIEEIHMEFNRIAEEERRAGREGKKFFDVFSDKVFLNRAAQLASYYLSLTDFIRYGQEAVRVVRELDTALTELRKVSDVTEQRLTQSFKTSADTAKELGSSISNVISATADWSRMGYDIIDSEELARISTLYKNVGDGIDIETANNSLISTLQGFKMDASEAIEIVDKYNEVANNFAISSAGIGEALQRSASSFKAANTDLSKSIALITTTNEVVQNPEAVGTLWKTLSARIRGKIVPIYNENYSLCA